MNDEEAKNANRRRTENNMYKMIDQNDLRGIFPRRAPHVAFDYVWPPASVTLHYPEVGDRPISIISGRQTFSQIFLELGVNLFQIGLVVGDA